MHIKELKSFQNGSLYALELDQLNVTDPFDQFALGREYLGYYYVTSEDIYYMPSDTGGYTEEKNEIIISGLESDEDLFLKEWTIVCCENGTADVVDDAGYHAFVEADGEKRIFATVYKGNIIKNLIMDCQSYTKYRPNETTGGIFVSWRRKEELPTGA